MGDTGANMAHWAGLYGSGGAPAAETTVVTAAAAGTVSSPTSGGSGGSPTRGPGIEAGRVGKPARRRSRASRRAPVTLLNTDTTNFRAMVQQFTGIPAPPAGVFGAPLINFAGDYGFPRPAGVMSFDHLHQQHAPAAALHEQLRRQQQQQQYTGGAFGYNNGLLHGAGGRDIFRSAEDRMLLQSIQSAQMPPASSAANNTSLGFFA